MLSNELGGKRRAGHAQRSAIVELVASAPTHVLHAPAMIGAEEVVLNQGVLVGIEDDVEAHVAIDMEGELESLGCVVARTWSSSARV